MSTTARTIPVHKDPLIFEPTGSHKTTMIVLHGRGSTAERFAEPFLTSAVSKAASSGMAEADAEDNVVFQDYFPNTKFVFPTAPLRRALAFNRSLTHQWFDKWSSQYPELRQHLQIPGLRETSTYLHGIMQQEIDIIGARNLALVGISQGCASSLIATLLWEGEPFAAVAGMCGYLPFRASMVDVVMDEENDEDNPFAVNKGDAETDESEIDTKSTKAIAWLRTELEMDGGDKSIELPMQSIPIFMGHGTDDSLIPCEHGRQAAEFLRTIDVDVEWNEYGGLDHWYSRDMLRDIIEFVKKRTGWESTTTTGFGNIGEAENHRES